MRRPANRFGARIRLRNEPQESRASQRVICSKQRRHGKNRPCRGRRRARREFKVLDDCDRRYRWSGRGGWSCTRKEAKMPTKQLEANVRQAPGVPASDG